MHVGLDEFAVHALLAGEADDLGQGSVEFDDITGPCVLVEPVDVLGDDRTEGAGPLQFGHRAVPGVGFGHRESLPADEAASPIALSGGTGRRELLVRHGGDPTVAIRTSVVGDAALRGDPGTGEDERWPTVAQQRRNLTDGNIRAHPATSRLTPPS